MTTELWLVAAVLAVVVQTARMIVLKFKYKLILERYKTMQAEYEYRDVWMERILKERGY